MTEPQAVPDDQDIDHENGTQVPQHPQSTRAGDRQLAEAQAESWLTLSDEQRQIVIIGELVLAARRRRGLSEWLEVGHAIEVLQHEVMRQSNSTANSGRRYNQAWVRLAPPMMKSLNPTTRSRALWLWAEREVIAEWWQTIEPEKRDKWGHPTTIKKAYDRAHRPPPPDRTDDPGYEAYRASRRRAAARSIDESTRDLQRAGLNVGNVIDQLAQISGVEIGERSALHYDLSTEQSVHDGAELFYRLHSSHGLEPLRRFVTALTAILDREPPIRSSPRFRRGDDADVAPSPRFRRGDDAADNVASVSFMITNARRVALRELGYSDQQIRTMTPVEAHRILAEGRIPES